MLTNNLPHSLPMHAVNPSEITKFLASRATIDVHPEHHPARNHSRPRICRSTDCIHHRPSPLAAQSNLASRVYEPKCPIKSSPPPSIPQQVHQKARGQCISSGGSTTSYSRSQSSANSNASCPINPADMLFLVHSTCIYPSTSA